MQDKYAGDIGDFGKYFLLKKIHSSASGEIRLGVNWYLCAPEEHGSNDGRHISYLFPEDKRQHEYIKSDPLLYSKLHSMVKNNLRSVNNIEAFSILPKGTIFYSVQLPVKQKGAENILAERVKWFSRSVASLQKAEIIFLDPDNGIAPLSASKTEKRGIKYCFLDEIKEYYQDSKTVVVYNHRDRSPSEKYFRRLKEAGREVCGISSLHIFRFKRVSVRDYLVFSRPEHKDIFSSLAADIGKGRSNFLFDKIL